MMMPRFMLSLVRRVVRSCRGVWMILLTGVLSMTWILIRASIKLEKAFFQKISEICQCAVCLETLRRDIAQCVNGHLICVECKEDLEACPTCRADFSDGRPSGLISQIVEALPPRCKYKNCNRNLDAKDDHEKYCDLRPIRCKLEDCHWEGPLRSVLQHLRKRHPNDIVTSDNSNKFKVIINHFGPGVSKQYFKGASLNGIFFWLEMYNDFNKKVFTHKFHFFLDKKPKSDIFLKLWASAKEVKYVYKFKVELDDEEEEKNIVYIPKHVLSYLTDAEERFSCNICFEI